MNDTERDLRELFEAKARDAGGAPPVTPEVLRRGRRRQAGTVAIAGLTALAVAAAAVVSLQALHRADTSVPGGSTGNPAFTATIQNFTLMVPKGWTLIDQWPLGANIAVDSTSSKFSCVGIPVEAGSGQKAPSSMTDCPDQQTQTPEPPAIPQGGLPMLTLSSDDPGLGGSVCNAGGSVPASSARLYIGLDYGATRAAGWESDILPWPQPLVNVLEGDLPIEQMPCGPGGYAWFQTGGMPFVAWAGFGSDVTDADRQAIVDTFNGMQVSDAEITPPTTETPGYVLTGGTVGGSTTMWGLEASPSARNVELNYNEVGGRVGGAGDFTVPDIPIETGGFGHGVEFGAVTFEADRVELRPTDGSDPLPGSILQLPDSLGAPFDAFVAPVGAGGEIVAVGPTGDLGSIPTTPNVGPEPAPTAEDVQSDLRNAYVAAKTYYTDGNTFEGFDLQVARSFGTSLRFNGAPQATAGEVSIRDVAADHILFAEATATGDVLCIAENDAGRTTYGAVDAQTVDECVGGEAAWGQDAAGPPAFGTQPTESSVDLQGFASPARLTVRKDTANDCLSIAIAIGDNEGAGTCGGGSLQPVSAYMFEDRPGVDVILGYASPEADQVYLVSDDGQRFDATTLYTLQVEPSVQFFAFSVPVTSGLLHVTDVSGVELRSPIPLNSAP
jgi:hypothetical protein